LSTTPIAAVPEKLLRSETIAPPSSNLPFHSPGYVGFVFRRNIIGSEYGSFSENSRQVRAKPEVTLVTKVLNFSS
jgi:hypothetical protein